MADTKRQVPNLRFKGFTDNWEQRKLGEFGKATGGTSIESEFSSSGTYKVISIGSYSETHVYNDQGIRAKNSEKTHKRILNKNDLTMILNDKTASGRIIGSVLLIPCNNTFVYNPRTERIEPNISQFSPMFLYHYLNAPIVRQKIISNAQGNTQIYVNWSSISKVEYYLPRLNEQNKIGELLKNVSNLISLQQRKLDLLKQLKKGLLQKMFADKGSKRPILRFEGFNDDWEGRKLENSADYIRGSFPQPYGNKEWYGGTNAKPFVQVVDVNTNMRLNKKTKEQISVLAQPKSRFVPSDSIVVTLQGSIGRVAITQYDSYVDRTLLIFTKYKVPVDKYFWAYSIQNIFRIEKQKAPGGTIKTITKRALSSFEVSLPVQEEQKKIGTLLKNIDDIITSQQEEVSKLKKIKKSLLQQMFI